MQPSSEEILTNDIREMLLFAAELSVKPDPDELDIDAIVLSLITALALIRLTETGQRAIARSRDAIAENLVTHGGGSMN